MEMVVNSAESRKLNVTSKELPIWFRGECETVIMGLGTLITVLLSLLIVAKDTNVIKGTDACKSNIIVIM